jgi:glucan biosynthesis protein C
MCRLASIVTGLSLRDKGRIAVSRLDWPWPAKFAAILAIAFPVLLANYQLLVRYSIIGAVLNGRRIRRANAPTTPRAFAPATPPPG